jgi:hypothetical protein
MKDAHSIFSSKRAANIFFAIYGAAFLSGLLGLSLLPQSEATLRKVSLGVSYFFGLPIVLAVGLVALRKTGIWNGK